MTLGIDVLAVIRAPLESYPPSLNQVRLLSEAGFRVGVAELEPFFREVPATEGVARYRFGRHYVQMTGRDRRLIPRVADHIRFKVSVQGLLARTKPKVVIAFDPPAMHAIGHRHRANDGSFFLIWHFHELPDPLSRPQGGLLTRLAVKHAIDNVHYPDLVIFPDQDRGAWFSSRLDHKLPFLTVANCPLRQSVPVPTIKKVIPEVPSNEPIVLFQGWIGPSRSIETVIRGIRHWPKGRLVLVGPIYDSYRAKLESLAQKEGVLSCIHFLGHVPQKELSGITASASVGISLVSSKQLDDPAWRFTAGAINKRFEYMAAGIAQVTDNGPGVAKTIRNAGLSVDPDNVEAVAHAIASLVNDPERARKMGQAGHKLHIDYYNYQNQFAPVIERIGSAVRCAL